MAVGGGAGALAAAWREDILVSALIGGGSWGADIALDDLQPDGECTDEPFQSYVVGYVSYGN